MHIPCSLYCCRFNVAVNSSPLPCSYLGLSIGVPALAWGYPWATVPSLQRFRGLPVVSWTYPQPQLLQGVPVLAQPFGWPQSLQGTLQTPAGVDLSMASGTLGCTWSHVDSSTGPSPSDSSLLWSRSLPSSAAQEEQHHKAACSLLRFPITNPLPGWMPGFSNCNWEGKIRELVGWDKKHLLRTKRQVMHKAIAQYQLTDVHLVPEQEHHCLASSSQLECWVWCRMAWVHLVPNKSTITCPASLSFSAESDAIWHGIFIWSIWVSCPLKAQCGHHTLHI